MQGASSFERTNYSNRTIKQGVFGEFGWARFLVVSFLYKANPNPRKMICCGEKVRRNATFKLIFLGFLGIGLGLGVSSVS